jgi:hypothetical protein
MSLRQIYNSLNDIGLVGSQRQFSRDWLQRQPSYFSSSEARSREPSLEVLLVLYNKLWRRASASTGKPGTACQHREQLGQLAAEIRTTIGRRLQSVGSGDC